MRTHPDLLGCHPCPCLSLLPSAILTHCDMSHVLCPRGLTLFFFFISLCKHMLLDLMRLGILSLRPLHSLQPCPLYTKGLTSNQKLERAGRLQSSFPMFEEGPVQVCSFFKVSKLNSGCRFGSGGPLPSPTLRRSRASECPWGMLPVLPGLLAMATQCLETQLILLGSCPCPLSETWHKLGRKEKPLGSFRGTRRNYTFTNSSEGHWKCTVPC